MQFTYQAYGAAKEVTGSKHLFTFGDQRYLIDCGMFQGHREESDRKNRSLPIAGEGLSAVVLSHGHYDLCGNLPSLVKQGYDGNIYSTPATRDIANLILMDSAHIMAKDYEWMLRKAPDKRAYEPLYSQDDVIKTLTHFINVSYHRPFTLDGGARCEFYDAGHILGSSMVVLTVTEDGQERRVGFTGDLGRPGMPILRDPDTLPPLDYLVCEGTYGNRLHDPIDDAERQLGEVVMETVRKGGKVIIPSFAVGRTQELIYFLHLLKDAGTIPADLDIYVDSPMAVNATGIFRVHPECYDEDVHQAFLQHSDNPFGFAGLHYVIDAAESKKLNDRPNPCIIIASSGMCEGGRILHHLKNHCGNPRNTIVVVGFMAENTLGRAIADRRPEISIFGAKYPLRARVKILNTFSAHADYNDIRAWVAKLDLKRLRQAFLVHGEEDALTSLKKTLEDTGVRRVEITIPEKRYKLFQDAP